MADIPIIDFSAYTSNVQDGDKAGTACLIDEAFRNVGFVYLKNHGIPNAQVEEAFEWSKKFFALPLETKNLAPHPPGGSHHRGYSAPGVEKVSQDIYDATSLARAREIPDYKESFESGNWSDTLQPNIWPPDNALPGFKPFMESFFTQCTQLVHHVLDALSSALDVAPPGLSQTHGKSLFQLRLLHYPPIPASDLQTNKRQRINAHSDFGTLTLLFQDQTGGLEIASPRDGVFRAVEPVDGAVLVNIGDLMARWSNDRWESSVHRVGAPAGAGQEEMVGERFSIPFFACADPETVVEALPGCWGVDKPKRYEKVTAGGYVRMRMEALY